MTSRAERMQQRMRGAGHGQVEDVSFQLDFGDDLTSEIDTQTSPEQPPPRTTPTPNTSAKRRKLDTDAARSLLPAPAGISQARQAPGKPETQELEEGSSMESAQPAAEQPDTSPTTIVEEEDPNTVESLPPPRPVIPAPPISPVNRRAAAANTEVEESPADAPGSGRRRKITSSALASSARLQDALSPGDNETETVPISSPLVSKVRRTTIGTRRSTSSRGSRNSGASVAEDADELSPDDAGKSGGRTLSPELSSRHETQAEESVAHSDEPTEEPQPEPEPETELHSEPEAEPEPESLVEEEEPSQADDSVAEEVDANEAAQRLGRKRPRRSPRGPSAEQDSTLMDEDNDDPLPKRRKKQTQASPAKQKQGRPKAASKTKSPPKAAPKRRKKKDSDAPGGDETVAIPVQRFTTKKTQAEGDDDDADILNSDIPFTSRGGVNTVDVLTTMCEEVLGTSLETLKEGMRNAEDAATKKERRVQMRALEAYREELRNRFLQHTILLDTLHNLRKRVRSVQKERITLRDEIMRIRAERDQVAIRKDSVRIKHDKVKEEALNQLSLSSQMHDIDLAVERGRAAPELGPAEKKTAELANLEILISRITDQACTQSDTGGTLKQIKDFNAFLERAAVALEGR
ncbi:at hook motif protein [Colletotrichum kahawae]|uniref:At hook motif protein n=1 Tax=Colletotrichum kahawae TaxID=34407 RepID=A0AAD9Y7X5_COLKA|nr:at hook motif protein [Colletotrichum kahawae]